MHKLSRMLPASYCSIISSYLDNRQFAVNFNSATSSISDIEVGVLQGSAFGPILYLLYTADVPTPAHVTVAMFADDTAVLSTSATYQGAVATLQSAIDAICESANRWKIKMNEVKSIRVDFALRPCSYLPITFGNELVALADSARYLGFHLDSKLTWQTHIKTKREHIKGLQRQILLVARLPLQVQPDQ